MSNLPFRIEQRQTTPSKPGKAPRPVWVLVGPTYGYEDAIRAAGGHRWRGEWSFWEDPTDALDGIQRSSFAERVDAQQDRAADRAERYAGYATNAGQRADDCVQRSHALVEHIPLGQPIAAAQTSGCMV